MIIKEIKLENIRSHSDTNIKFTPGINMITGNTGSGKSSILMSVEYALFGKIGEGKEEGKMLIRRNTNEAAIEITLIDRETEYKIGRGLKRVNETVRNDDSKNYINKNSIRIDLQNRASDINTYVSRLLKIESDNPLKTFETITYIKQDELKNLIFETGQYKQEYIDGLLQLNKYLRVYENLREVITAIKNEVELDKKELSLSTDENDMIKTETKINENKNIIKTITDEMAQNMIILNNKEIEKKQKESEMEFERDKKIVFEKALTGIKLRKDENIKLEKEKEKIYEKIEELNKNIPAVEIGKKHELEEQIKTFKHETNQKNAYIKELYQEFYKLEFSYKTAENELKELTKEADTETRALQELIVKKQTFYEQLEKIVGMENKEEITGRLFELDKLIKELEKEKNKSIEKRMCLLCGNTITDATHIKEEYDNKIIRYVEQINELKNIYDNIKYSRNDIEKNIKLIEMKIETTENNIKKINTKFSENNVKNKKMAYEQVKDEYAALSRELEDTDMHLKNTEEELEKIENHEKNLIEIGNYGRKAEDILKSLEYNQSEINRLENEVVNIKFEENALSLNENALKLVAEEINKINYRITEIRKEIELRKTQLEEDKIRLEEIKIKLRKKEEISRLLNKKEGMLKMISDLREDIRSIREYVRLKFINEFRSLFKSRFEELRSDTDYSISIDNNYNAIITAENEEMDAKALSGGEKTSVAIAYRLALSSLASILGGGGKNEMILMDEPTSGLDREDISALTGAITKITDLKQIIIVTHEDSMKNIADNVIKLKKEAGRSMPY